MLNLNISLFANLKYLDLSNNKLTENIFASMVRLIYGDDGKKGNNKKINQNNLIPNGNDSEIKPLLPALAFLDLSKNYISLESL